MTKNVPTSVKEKKKEKEKELRLCLVEGKSRRKENVGSKSEKKWKDKNNSCLVGERKEKSEFWNMSFFFSLKN